jgi:hypothetical protein
VKRALSVSNKLQMAQSIATRFPELAPRLPPERKPWMSEDCRMAIFRRGGVWTGFVRKREVGSVSPPLATAIPRSRPMFQPPLTGSACFDYWRE